MLAIKLDHQKASDRVKWRFLIKASRGFRQGNPITSGGLMPDI